MYFEKNYNNLASLPVDLLVQTPQFVFIDISIISILNLMPILYLPSILKPFALISNIRLRTGAQGPPPPPILPVHIS